MTKSNEWEKEFDEMWAKWVTPYDTTGPELEVVKEFVSDLLTLKDQERQEAVAGERGRCQRIVEKYYPEIGRGPIFEHMAIYKVWKEIGLTSLEGGEGKDNK